MEEEDVKEKQIEWILKVEAPKQGWKSISRVAHYHSLAAQRDTVPPSTLHPPAQFTQPTDHKELQPNLCSS